MGERRVAITGMGVVAPGDVGTKAMWERIVSGVPATRLITAFDATPFRSRVAAECDFDPRQEGLTEHDVERLDRVGQLLLVAAAEALEDSDFACVPGNAHRVGASIGNAVGCTQRLEQEYLAVSDEGRQWLVDQSEADHLSLFGGLYGGFVAPLVRLQAEAAVGALAARFPALRHRERVLRRMRSPVSRGVLRFPVGTA